MKASPTILYLGKNILLKDNVLSELLEGLNQDNEHTYIVGGAVRNLLYGDPLQDIDLATTLLPGPLLEKTTELGFRSIATGGAHGTVTVSREGRHYEITPLREDVETYGRHARVRFGTNRRLDALRRDFTINALFLTQDGRIFDEIGGLQDIFDRRIRFIGSPLRRIQEDVLRILRFFRFQALYGVTPLDRWTMEAIAQERLGLLTLSRERIRGELWKLLLAPYILAVIDVMSSLDLFPLIFNERSLSYTPARLKAWLFWEKNYFPHELTHQKELPQQELPYDKLAVLMRLAALTLHDQAHLLPLQQACVLSRKETDFLSKMIRAYTELSYRPGAQSPIPAPLEVRLRVDQFGNLPTWAALSLYIIDTFHKNNSPEDFPTPQALPDVWGDVFREALKPLPPFPLKGDDLLARGIHPGPSMGDLLQKIKKNWLALNCPSDPQWWAEQLKELSLLNLAHK